MQQFDVAVIIPVLNEQRNIERCITSLVSQSFPFEKMDVIIVDGGSKDDTIDIVSGILERYSNVRLIHNPKKIQAVAFNVGVEVSSAPIVIRLDAHALYHKDYIRLIVEGLQNREYGNVGGRWIMAPQSNTLMGKANAIANQMRFAIGGADFRVGTEKREVETVPFGGFRREVIEEVGGMNPTLPRGEDNEYNARILKAGYRILFDPMIVATYYARPDLLTFLRQMYANGFSIGVLMHCYRQSVGLRHIVPFLFFLSIVILIIAGVFFKSLWWVLLGELGLYFLCDTIASVMEAKKYGCKYLLVLPWEIFLIHLSYGYGTLVGLFKRQY